METKNTDSRGLAELREEEKYLRQERAEALERDDHDRMIRVSRRLKDVERRIQEAEERAAAAEELAALEAKEKTLRSARVVAFEKDDNDRLIEIATRLKAVERRLQEIRQKVRAVRYRGGCTGGRREGLNTSSLCLSPPLSFLDKPRRPLSMNPPHSLSLYPVSRDRPENEEEKDMRVFGCSRYECRVECYGAGRPSRRYACRCRWQNEGGLSQCKEQEETPGAYAGGRGRNERKKRRRWGRVSV